MCLFEIILKISRQPKIMKNLSLIVAVYLTASIMAACTKSIQKTPSVNITGDWTLVSDSSLSVPYNPGGINTPGPLSQHYNFQSGGNLSWTEHTFSCDSASYSLQSGGTLMITFYPKSNPNYSGTNSYKVVELTANKMVLLLIQSTAPGTILGATMVFSK
jgi:hypothetical protein